MEMLKVSLIYLIGTGTEKNHIEGRIDEWTDQFESCGAKVAASSMDLTKDTCMVK
jgi:hypothetical protein